VLNFVVSLASTKRPTILIADDNYGLRSLLSAILTRDGYRVVEAVDGVGALRLLAEENVDAVLMDVHFGAEDGIALGRELRRFLMKPFTLESATATVEHLLGRR
jgi:two-component system OmpR family response regulator